MTHMVEV